MTLSSKFSSCLLTAAALFTASIVPTHAGPVLHLQYYGLPAGITVDFLTNSPSFPDSPSIGVAWVNGLASPIAAMPDNSGSWTRGFIEAPETGVYTFWIASDDSAELWLSPNHDPAGKAIVCYNVGWVEPGQYQLRPEQQSAPISLVAGQKYYFEIRHKEELYGDHVSVMWQMPGGRKEHPIAASHLWPFPVDTTNPASYPAMDKLPALLTDYLGTPVPTLPATMSVTEGEPIELSVSIDASQPAGVRWLSNNVPIPGANLLTYRIPAASLAMSGATYTVEVTNSLGGVTASTVISVNQDLTAPFLADALNFGNAAGTVAVIFSEPVKPSTAANKDNYTIAGVTVSSAVMGTQPNEVLLATSGLTPGVAYVVTVNNVQDLAATPNTITPGSVVAIENDLLTWLRLDEFTGTTLNDSSVNNLDGELLNGTLPGFASPIKNGVRFDGVDDYVEMPDDYADFSSGLTLALWAKPQPSSGGWLRFIEFANGAFNNDNILFARNGTTDRISYEVYQGGDGGPAITSYDVLKINQWQHVAVTMDGAGGCVVYYNGLPVATGTSRVPNNVIRANARLARSNWTFDSYYAGYMDDVRIYRRPLSPSAILALAAGSGQNDGPATVISVDATVAETALHNTPPGVFTVTRTGSTASPLTVQFALEGSAVNGTHYTNLPGSVVIPAGAASATVYITPIDASFTEPFRTAVLRLLGSANYGLADAFLDAVTIANNADVVPPVPLVATADGRILNVWFDEPVAPASATTPANYTLSTAGVSITNAAMVTENLNAGGYHLGVVLQASAAVPAGATLTVSGVRDSAGNHSTYVIPANTRLAPAKIVANSYHRARWDAFNRATDGNINNSDNGGTGFDTWDGNTGLSQFVGLLYQEAREINAVRVDLGQQFSDGGSWVTRPQVYLLKDYYDTDLVRPETHPSWVQVPAQLVSGARFDSAGDGNPSLNTPIVFDLSALPASQRTGYGWAIGGVAGDNTVRFISISELRGFGNVVGTNRLSIVQHPKNTSVIDGNQAYFKVLASGTLPISYQWQRDEADIPGATLASYAVAPTSVADNNAAFRVIVTNPWGSLTSSVATLTITAPAGPKVLAATIDNALDVWFDHPVTATAGTPSNYVFNDPGLTITGIIQDAYGCRASLALSGTPTVSPLMVTVSGVEDMTGHIMAAPQTVNVQPLAWPAINAVASDYQQGRAAALTRSTNGIVLHDFGDFWTTWGRDETDFVGLRYAEQKLFGLIKIDLARQFGDGGSWSELPRVFILKEPADTDRSLPEQDPRWVEVLAPVLISESRFDAPIDAGDGEIPPNSPIAFDLSSVPMAQRTGYGWAVGGVLGDVPTTASFVSVGELRAFGITAPTSPVLTITFTGGEVMISWPTSAVGYDLYSTPTLSPPNWQLAAESPQQQDGIYFIKPPVAGAPKFYRLQK